jgi:hypothetical protein
MTGLNKSLIELLYTRSLLVYSSWTTLSLTLKNVKNIIEAYRMVCSDGLNDL